MTETPEVAGPKWEPIVSITLPAEPIVVTSMIDALITTNLGTPLRVVCRFGSDLVVERQEATVNA